MKTNKNLKDNFYPIFTEKTICQDCYKCVRHCVVKAIRVEDHSAFVDHDKCITCGTCVNVCPSHAKKIRNDLDRLDVILENNEKVICSIAPSFVTEFDDIQPEKIIHFLKRIGFYGVSETALGAEEVSTHIADLLRTSDQDIFISTACPVIVKYIQHEYPEYVKYLTPLLSPLLSHCKILRKEYGNDIKIVFFGPCIAKKDEADENTDLLEIALTFDDFRTLISKHKSLFDSIDANDDITKEQSFIPHMSHEGALYPIDGGMIKGVETNRNLKNVHSASISGLEAVDAALKGLNEFHPNGNDEKIFLELLSCAGGCVNGPTTKNRNNTINKQIEINRYTQPPTEKLERKTTINISKEIPSISNTNREFGESQIIDALRSIGKYKPEDELNCGGCGYDSCRNFARALLSGRAEKSMCVSYMRKLASKKANALITAMPGGVVIVDDNLQVIECNKRFVELICNELIDVYDGISSMKGLRLIKVITFTDLFRKVLSENVSIIDKEIKHNNGYLKLSLFPIEKNKAVVAIIEDVTQPVVQRDQIIEKAEKVIQKNLQTAQKIAYLLGENAADSEVILSSIINSFSSKSVLSDKKETRS